MIHFKFYLDICDHQLTKTIEEKITALGGCLEFFLTPNVTHFITDKSITCNNNNNININKVPDIFSRNRSDTPGTPATPTTPYTPYSQEQLSCESTKNAANGSIVCGSGTQTVKKVSRADAMLNKARRGNTTIHDKISSSNNNNNNSIVFTSSQQPYIIWSTEYALRFFKRISHHLKDYLESGSKRSNAGESYRPVEPISLKGGFIKIESTRYSQRPYYQLFRKPTEWPKIELSRDDGAFRLSPKRELAQDNQIIPVEGIKMTRKSRSRPSQCHATNAKEKLKQSLKKSGGDSAIIKTHNAQTTANALHVRSDTACKHIKESSEKQCGVCEICKIEYDTLTIHLQTKDHEYFAKNSQNFIALDTLIHATADVNKFLDANKSIGLKSQMEDEIEVAEETTGLEVDVPDPLEDHEQPPSTPNKVQPKKRSSGSSQNTPSPTLREKSKRSTKGKHSSEKFQYFSTVRSARSASTSPQKKPCRTTTNNSQDLQKCKDEPIIPLTPVSAVAASCKKPKPSALISPPFRAMLPPSSLYKVVETTAGRQTSPRKARDSAAVTAAVSPTTVASPSLIVKFKKVRQAELLRLNGEAESFMFPRCRTSSELPTDFDRDTTSDNMLRGTSMSSSISTSLDSSSENQVNCATTFADEESYDFFGRAKKAKTKTADERKFVVAKRRKARPCGAQNFPSAPIQPDEFTVKHLPNESLTASITLPEATRKSSRTATAIVTAATKSSRLLRAAVEAARNNKRLLSNDCSQTKCTEKMLDSAKSERNKISRSNKTLSEKRIAAMVKLEDRMGDADEEQDTDETDNDEDENKTTYDEDDDVESDDDEEEEDDDDDEDYVTSYAVKKKLPKVESNRMKRTCAASNRGQVVENNKIKKQVIKEEIETDEDVFEPKKKAKAISISNKNKSVKTPKTTPKKRANVPGPALDISKCERLQEQRYSFERVPVFDSWYRVFSRQDAGKEVIPEYYGSTNYRKLPYELGPIPFNRTLDGICCKLCGIGVSASPNKCLDDAGDEVKHKVNDDEVPTDKTDIKEDASDLPPRKSPSPAPPVENPCSKYTHKKLHLLQRYRREQQELLQKQQEADQKLDNSEPQLNSLEIVPNDDQQGSMSKSSTPDRESHAHRAGSTHSNVSSCTSSSCTTFSKKFPRNKHLNKAAFLSLELPPRKSPREHASTLAFVSCLIKQRQDSQSKPNSEIDEPPLTPPNNFINEEHPSSSFLKKAESISTTTTPMPDRPLPQSVTAEIRDTGSTVRSSAGTPIEEMRFATEISENVKRLRRGQNKYDHSPIVASSALTSRSRSTNKDSTTHDLSGNDISSSNMNRRRKQDSKYAAYRSNKTSKHGKTPIIQKTGCKKGVLEFEMNEAALEVLESSRNYPNVRKLAREIDQFLQVTGKDYDIEEPQLFEGDSASSAKQTSVDVYKDTPLVEPPDGFTNTPPPTDYFSSDFDLYDLFTSQLRNDQRTKDNLPEKKSKYNSFRFSFHGSEALHNYFKKRKSLKSNRTGWPKAQRRKTAAQQQKEKNAYKINFLKDGPFSVNVDEEIKIKEEIIEEDEYEDDQKERRKQENGMITPPDTDDLDEDEAKTTNDIDEEDADDTELDAGESIKEDCDADTIIEEDSADDRTADGEMEDYNHRIEVDECISRTDDFHIDEAKYAKKYYGPKTKRNRRGTMLVSPTTAKLSATPITTSGTASTSTPCTHIHNARRSTPQLNGSLGSCVSPSEKADNSDIFTVSSDGLDTDMDLSNSHTTLLKTIEEQCQEHAAISFTPKRKFDLAKYARSNNAATVSAASGLCAVEAASASVKSLAISQFLTKEVKVTCRRLRAPFRRFRYRR